MGTGGWGRERGRDLRRAGARKTSRGRGGALEPEELALESISVSVCATSV